MSQDIAGVLEGWDFDPHELNVRIIKGDDQQEKIQMRIDLGLIQMCLYGRPDGQRPFGYESVFAYYLHEAESYGDGYALSGDALEELFREGLQYYHRYLCLFHLANYELVVRDTERNISMFQFVLEHAKKRRDQWRFDQYRPYVLMMNTRAKAMLALESHEVPKAIDEIEEGCERIREFLDHYGRNEEECFELDFLQRWGEELKTSGRAVDPEMEVITRAESKAARGNTARDPDLTALRNQLAQAIEREEYERAAVIRDRIKRMEKDQKENEKPE